MPAEQFLISEYDSPNSLTSQQFILNGHDDASGDPVEKPLRTRHSRKQPEGHIPRPPNAFILFRSSFIRSQRVTPDVETNHSTLSKIIGLTWQNLPADERRVWQAKAAQGVEEHRRRFPKYAFRPVHRRDREGNLEPKRKQNKRKVREQAVHDPERCAKIAELLGAGKHGRTLEAAMQEFDRQRVFNVDTRFEAPITATTYRRSSSAPIPDTEPSTSFLCSTTAVAKRRRSSSTGPASIQPVDPPHVTPDNFSDSSSAFDAFIPSWNSEPESDYFDFSGFSFASATPPDFACDPPHPMLSPPPVTNNFKYTEERTQEYAHGIESAALIPEYTRSLDAQALFCQTYSNHSSYSADSAFLGCDAVPSYLESHEQMWSTIANPQPRLAQVETQFSNLMAQY